MGGFFAGSIPSVNISDSTVVGRTLLTSATTQAQRIALDIFVNAVSLGAFPVTGNLECVYIAADTSKAYAWNGSAYIEVSPNTHTRSGAKNTFVNDSALSSVSLSGDNNTAVGDENLAGNTSGAQNTGCGALALQYNSTGSYNTAIGFESMGASNVISDFNTGCGIQACKNNSSGTQNSGFGAGSLRDNFTGSNNTGAGFTALLSCTGSDNTAIGSQAGDAITSGGSNTLIGKGADVDTGSRNYCVVIGKNATSPAVAGSLSIGGTSADTMTGLTTVTAPSGVTGSYLRIWLNGTEYRIPIQAAT